MIRDLRARWQRLSCDERGQAMVEYTVILAAVTAAVVVPFPSALFPAPLAGRTFMAAMLDAYHAYYISFYYVLNLPFP